MVERRWTSWEQVQARMARTDWMVCLLSLRRAGRLEGGGGVSLVPEAEEVEGWGKSCFISPSAWVGQAQCEVFRVCLLTGRLMGLGVLAGGDGGGVRGVGSLNAKRSSVAGSSGGGV